MNTNNNYKRIKYELNMFNSAQKIRKRKIASDLGVSANTVQRWYDDNESIVPPTLLLVYLRKKHGLDVNALLDMGGGK